MVIIGVAIAVILAALVAIIARGNNKTANMPPFYSTTYRQIK
jgi:FlaG/FlaF family flagellin (archaellin)